MYGSVRRFFAWSVTSIHGMADVSWVHIPRKRVMRRPVWSLPRRWVGCGHCHVSFGESFRAPTNKKEHLFLCCFWALQKVHLNGIASRSTVPPSRTPLTSSAKQAAYYATHIHVMSSVVAAGAALAPGTAGLARRRSPHQLQNPSAVLRQKPSQTNSWRALPALRAAYSATRLNPVQAPSSSSAAAAAPVGPVEPHNLIVIGGRGRAVAYIAHHIHNIFLPVV